MYLKMPEPIGWVTDKGEFGTNNMVIFNPDQLDERQWNILNELYEGDRFNYALAIVTHDRATAYEIEVNAGFNE